MTDEKLFLDMLSGFVSVTSSEHSPEFQTELYMRTWALLDTYPQREVCIHDRGFYALGVAMASWTGYDCALFFLEDLYRPVFRLPTRLDGRKDFGQFWAALDYSPLIPLAAEENLQVHTRARCDEYMETDYQAAHRLGLAGAEDRLLIAALCKPGLLTTHEKTISGMPTEYASAALGLFG